MRALLPMETEELSMDGDTTDTEILDAHEEDATRHILPDQEADKQPHTCCACCSKKTIVISAVVALILVVFGLIAVIVLIVLLK